MKGLSKCARSQSCRRSRGGRTISSVNRAPCLGWVNRVAGGRCRPSADVRNASSSDRIAAPRWAVAKGQVLTHALQQFAPVGSGWSGCRVGLAPTGKRRLFTAHARNGHPDHQLLIGSTIINAQIRMRSMRGMLWRARNLYQRPSRSAAFLEARQRAGRYSDRLRLNLDIRPLRLRREIDNAQLFFSRRAC
jgi:hypothetical protein